LLAEEIYDGDDEKLTNDLRGLFLAGNETVNVTTANLIYYLTAHKQY
jgi:cytochrome P450